MSFATASKKAEDVKQSGSEYIGSSGIYEVDIIAPIVNVSNGGSQSVDMYLEHNGQKQIIYGSLRITNNDDSPNKIGAKIFNQLIIIADLEDISDPIEAELPIGKKGAFEDCAVLEDLSDLSVLMRIQMEYGAYNGSIQEKKVIKGFYRLSDKATAEEIVNDSETGIGYDKEQKYVDNITYNDGVTPEQVTAWISAKRPKGTAGDSASEGGSGKKKAPAFGSKKRSAKKDEE